MNEVAHVIWLSVGFLLLVVAGSGAIFACCVSALRETRARMRAMDAVEEGRCKAARLHHAEVRVRWFPEDEKAAALLRRLKGAS